MRTAAFLLVWLLAVVAVHYGPIVVKLWRHHRIPVHQRYAPYAGPPPALSQVALDAMAATSRSLADCGYRLLECFSHTRPDGITTSMALHDRPDGVATAVALTAVRNGQLLRGGQIVTFVTEFVDGAKLSTNNASSSSAMRRDPLGTIVQFPEVGSAAELDRLHMRLVRRRGAAVRSRRPEDDPSRFMSERVDADMARQVELGTLRPAGDGVSYRLTLAGAALMAWRAAPPSASLLRWLLRNRARRLSRALLDDERAG